MKEILEKNPIFGALAGESACKAVKISP